MTEYPELRKMELDYLSSVFGIKHSPDIKIIPEGKSGGFYVKDDFDIDQNIIFQKLMYEDIEISNNNPANLGIHDKFIKAAKGDILIIGLGLGTSLHEILKSPDVESITIIEKEQDIINLVAPYFTDNRVETICSDALTYARDKHYDLVYIAIWDKKESVNIDELNTFFDLYKGRSKKIMSVFYSGKQSGGKRQGAGRKAGWKGEYKDAVEKRTVRKGIQYTSQEYELIIRAAKAIGKTETYVAQIGAVREARLILASKGLLDQ